MSQVSSDMARNRAYIETLMRNGASLRHRHPHGFYCSRDGGLHKVCQIAAEAMLRDGTVRLSLTDQHGVRLMTLNPRKVRA